MYKAVSSSQCSCIVVIVVIVAVIGVLQVPVSFGLYLEVPMPSLNQALGYSYRDRETSTPSGAIADEADNNRAMV